MFFRPERAKPMRLRIIIPATAPRSVRPVLLPGSSRSLAWGLYGYAYLERVLYQAHESRAFDQARGPRRCRVASDNKIAPLGRVVRSSRKSPTALIGRLSVPRLHLSAMVREGVGRKHLTTRHRPHSGDGAARTSRKRRRGGSPRYLLSRAKGLEDRGRDPILNAAAAISNT